jgi:hypothetical protein
MHGPINPPPTLCLMKLSSWIWAGGTPAGKKHHSTCTLNTAEKTQDYPTISTFASDEQIEMASKILSLETDFTKHLKLIVKQSKDSNKVSQWCLEATETLGVTQSKQILEMFAQSCPSTSQPSCSHCQWALHHTNETQSMQ